MNRENIILNTIFYVILTAFFIYIFVKEKKIVAKIDKKRTIFEDYLVNKFKLNGKTSEMEVFQGWKISFFSIIVWYLR